MVAAVTQKNVEVLFDVIGYPEGKTDPRFATVATKEANWPALLELIERWTSQRSGAECEAVLMQAGVPCSRYRTVGEAMADPQIQARGTLGGRADADLHEAFVDHQPLGHRLVHPGAVAAGFAEVVFPGVAMSVEVDDGQRPTQVLAVFA